MNVKLGYTMNFLAGVWYDNRLQFNSYHAGFTLLTLADQPKEFNLAMERLKYLVYDMFTDTVFIDSNDQEQIGKLVQAGLKVTTLPDVPVDQIVNIALFSGSVYEGRQKIGDMGEALRGSREDFLKMFDI